MKAERALLHGFARHGWDGQREVPKETVEKYGLTEDVICKFSCAFF